MVISAKFEDGVFKPLAAVSVAEGTILDISIPIPAEPAVHRFDSHIAPEFVGMWGDRADLADSVEYVNNLRRPRS